MAFKFVYQRSSSDSLSESIPFFRYCNVFLTANLLFHSTKTKGVLVNDVIFSFRECRQIYEFVWATKGLIPGPILTFLFCISCFYYISVALIKLSVPIVHFEVYRLWLFSVQYVVFSVQCQLFTV